MYIIILVYLIFLSLDNISSTSFNQTTEETTKENELNNTQTESTGFTENISTHSKLEPTSSPNKLIACGQETLTMSCPDTHVVTGDITAGRNDIGTCAYQPDGCNGDPVEPPILREKYTCLWNQSHCEIRMGRYHPTQLNLHSDKCGSGPKYTYIAARNFDCVPRNLVHQQCISPRPVEIRNSSEGYIMIPYIYTKYPILKPRNCNVTWIATPETRNIKITAGDKDPYEKACNSGKLVITATASSGVRYSCTFCDTKGFSLTFSYPKSVTFDVVDPDKIAGKTWYRVWFEASESDELSNIDNLPPECSLINDEPAEPSTTQSTLKPKESTKSPQKSIFADESDSSPSKVWPPALHQKAPVIWIAFGTIFVILIVIVTIMVYIYRQQRIGRRPRHPFYLGNFSPGEDESFLNLNNNNRNNIDHQCEEALDMERLARNGRSFREHVHSLREG